MISYNPLLYAAMIVEMGQVVAFHHLTKSRARASVFKHQLSDHFMDQSNGERICSSCVLLNTTEQMNESIFFAFTLKQSLLI